MELRFVVVVSLFAIVCTIALAQADPTYSGEVRNWQGDEADIVLQSHIHIPPPFARPAGVPMVGTVEADGTFGISIPSTLPKVDLIVHDERLGVENLEKPPGFHVLPLPLGERSQVRHQLSHRNQAKVAHAPAQQWVPHTTRLKCATDCHAFPITATTESAAILDAWIGNHGITI